MEEGIKETMMDGRERGRDEGREKTGLADMKSFQYGAIIV
jgi:hypothetical protein